MTPAKLRLAQAAMAKRDTKVGELCKELGVTRQTLYRFVDPKGSCARTVRNCSSVAGMLVGARALQLSVTHSSTFATFSFGELSRARTTNAMNADSGHFAEFQRALRATGPR